MTADPAARSVLVQIDSPAADASGNPSAAFTASPPDRAADPAGTVAVADLTGDNRPDTLTLDGAGAIRFYEAGAGGVAPPPVVVNPGRRATDFAVIDTAAGRAVAAVAADGTLTLYRRTAKGFSGTRLFIQAPASVPSGMSGMNQIESCRVCRLM